ncbi:MAG: hypothetical protein DRG78_23030, partial [Epsilonproteobacteria bacterium]
MSFNFLEITNNTGNINKVFTWSESKCSKTSNARVYNATFQEKSFNTLEEFDAYLANDIQTNQAICLGKSKHSLTQGKLLTKGQEDISNSTISRSNAYLENQDALQLCLGDIDADTQMSDEMIEVISTQDSTYDAVLELHGDGFSEVSVRSGSSSSTGIVDTVTEEPVYVSNSQHLYWILLNADTPQDLDRYVEFLKRRAVIKKFWFLKIHKDGSTSFRTLLDLSVIKSMQSRLSFEAPATVGEGLKKMKQTSKFYNTTNGLIPFNLQNIEYKSLPNWRVVYEQAKLDNKGKINAIKKQYRADKILELVQLHNFSESEAALIIDEYLTKSNVSASMILKAADDKSHKVSQFLIQGATSWDVYDIFDYKKGLGKTYINVKNIFNANVYTYLRGGVTYNISFTIDEILNILNTLDYKEDVTKILFALIDYVVTNEFGEDAVSKIIELLESNNCSFEFEKFYYKNYINFTVAEKMSDFAFIMMDGKTGVFRKSEDGDLTLYTLRSIADLFLNKNFYSKDPNNLKKTILVDVVKHWLRSQGREEFTSVVFTDKETAENEYNLFRGFAYEPINHQDIDLEPYFTLVKDVIANGDELFCNINHSFIAQMLQDPFNKLGTA